MSDDDETDITEITIQPDGRVYVFGTSRGVLEVLEDLRPDDAKLRRLLGHVRRLEAEAPKAEVSACSRNL
jgi:hypothetical protein